MTTVMDNIDRSCVGKIVVEERYQSVDRKMAMASCKNSEERYAISKLFCEDIDFL